MPTESNSVDGIMRQMEGCIRRELAEKITASLQALAPAMIGEAATKFNAALHVLVEVAPNQFSMGKEITIRIKFDGPLEVEGNGRRS
jgi:hypothetical protein